MGDYSVFAAQIDLLLNDLNFSHARFYPKGSKENTALTIIIKYAPLSQRIKERANPGSKKTAVMKNAIHEYAHVLSDGSILVLPPPEKKPTEGGHSVAPVERNSGFSLLTGNAATFIKGVNPRVIAVSILLVSLFALFALYTFLHNRHSDKTR